MENKHAYCILAHNNLQQLCLLIKELDHPQNDIYLHLDIKFKCDIKKIKTNSAGLFLFQKFDVRWSDISQLDTEVFLYSEVLKSSIKYERIHLISGSDFPIKSQEYIHKYFLNRTEEFIDLQTDNKFINRIKYYHFFVKKRRTCKIWELLRKLLLIPQILFINRLKKCELNFAYGYNWCSLTLPAVYEIVSNIKKYRTIFLYTTSPDELYKQMILLNNNQFKIAKESSLRFVKFYKNQASPKILIIDDYNEIINSNALFARKFDISQDPTIVYKIMNNLK